MDEPHHTRCALCGRVLLLVEADHFWTGPTGESICSTCTSEAGEHIGDRPPHDPEINRISLFADGIVRRDEPTPS